MLCGSGVDTAVRAGNEAIFGGAIQGVAGKNAGTGGRAGRHILWADRFPLAKVNNSHACVLDQGAAWQTRHFNGGARRSIAEFKAPSVTLIHNVHRDLRSQIRIDEDHVAEFETGRLHDSLHAVKRQIDLRRWVVRNLAADGIAASHTGYEKPVVSKNAWRR